MTWLHIIRIISAPIRDISKFWESDRKLLKRSFAELSSDFTKAQPFRRQRSRKVKNDIFERNRFSITTVFETIEQWFRHHRVGLVKTHRNMYSMTFKGLGQNLTSGQDHVATQVCHIAYDLMRLDERNTSRSLPRLYLFWIKGYLQKTVGELRWPQMTFWGSPMKTVTWVITEDLRQHHSEWMEMFRCGKEEVERLPIDSKVVYRYWQYGVMGTRLKNRFFWTYRFLQTPWKYLIRCILSTPKQNLPQRVIGCTPNTFHNTINKKRKPQ